MLGWQNPPDAFYALADLFVCPSRHEPLGNVILEAWNHSVPVVSTRSDGAMELIEEGRTGLLCDCKDDAGMADAIVQALDAPASNRESLAAAGNRELQAKYGQAAIVEQYLDLYARVLAMKR
jgi:glycosyltransferase involved in cell wall biosynthesis